MDIIVLNNHGLMLDSCALMRLSMNLGRVRGPLSVILGKGKSWDGKSGKGHFSLLYGRDQQTFSVMIQIIASVGFAKCQLSSIESGAVARSK